jgi:predicted nucleic acid-binding protein
MNDGKPVLLDVNVPMYAAGQAHPLKEACGWIMQEIAEGRLNVAIDSEIIQEILYRYGALKRWELATTMANSLFSLIPSVYAVTGSDARLAVELFQKYAPDGIKARDLIHAAVMLNNRLNRIISTDAHFDHIEGITRLDPQRLYEQRRDTM